MFRTNTTQNKSFRDAKNAFQCFQTQSDITDTIEQQSVQRLLTAPVSFLYSKFLQ